MFVSFFVDLKFIFVKDLVLFKLFFGIIVVDLILGFCVLVVVVFVVLDDLNVDYYFVGSLIFGSELDGCVGNCIDVE